MNNIIYRLQGHREELKNLSAKLDKLEAAENKHLMCMAIEKNDSVTVYNLLQKRAVIKYVDIIESVKYARLKGYTEVIDVLKNYGFNV